MRGLFLSFEGTDGCGKSTQMELLGKHLEGLGFDVVRTREPGGTPIGEEVRAILLDRRHVNMDAWTEALLYAAARAQHVREVILPALEKGAIVLCDRFLDSSIAYQGYGRGLGMEAVLAVNAAATGGVLPDRTFLLDVEPQSAFDRRSVKDRRDRMEDEKDAFFKRAYDGYLHLCEAYQARMVRVDASGTKEQTQERLRQSVRCLLAERDMPYAQNP